MNKQIDVSSMPLILVLSSRYHNSNYDYKNNRIRHSNNKPILRPSDFKNVELY